MPGIFRPWNHTNQLFYTIKHYIRLIL
jgi:hypothetical protein